jgi:hypothetical protein
MNNPPSEFRTDIQAYKTWQLYPVKKHKYLPNYMIYNFFTQTNWNLPLFVSYAQIAIAKVPTTIRINPASDFLLNFSLNTK